MCDQQSLRPACAYAQPDQSLCLSLEYSMIVKLLTERHLEFLSITGGCRGPSESTLVKMSNCWKSHALAHIIMISVLGYNNTLPGRVANPKINLRKNNYSKWKQLCKNCKLYILPNSVRLDQCSHLRDVKM